MVFVNHCSHWNLPHHNHLPQQSPTTGTTVSKSFARTNANGDPTAGVDTINISVASYRVVESKKHGKYAQFLVIYREGSIRDTVGLWKRYSDFEELAHRVTHSHESCAAAFANISPLSVAEEPETEHLPNAIHMDYFGADLIEKMDNLDKSKTYLVYCRSGRRSVRVCVLMRNSGFEKLYNLDGGMKMWV